MITRALHTFAIWGVLIALTTLSAQAADPIGNITLLSGKAHKIIDGQSTAIADMDPIFLNDTIQISPDGLAEINFIDETEITLGEDARLTVDEYVYDPNDSQNNKAEYSLIKGAFYYISGAVAKKEDPDVTLNLDFGSIGIRGTKIWRDMTLDEDGELQCRIYLEDGKARVSNTNGFVILNHGEGTKIRGASRAPTSVKPWGESAIAEIKSKTAMTTPE